MSKNRLSTAHYGPGGWMHWPEHEDHSFQFARLLGAAQEGASTISECFLTATRITAGDDESWYREWKGIADVSKARGDCAFEHGHVATAKSNWLRASNYYRSAEYFLKPEDDRRNTLFDLMENCSHLLLKHTTPQGEIVQIPYEESFMHGYFLRAPNTPSKTPAVVCFGGPDESKDDQLYKMPRHAFARNLSLLLVDLPGQGATVRRNKIVRRSDQEISIGHCVDYLLARGDVDATRIVLYGDGLGGIDASRAARFDNRLAAAVCDGGMWEQREQLYLVDWLSGTVSSHGSSNGATMARRWIASKIECPYLITIGEHDFIDIKDAFEQYDCGLEAGAKIDLKIFSAAETGAAHGQIDNPTIGKEFIFDWIAAKIAVDEMQKSHEG